MAGAKALEDPVDFLMVAGMVSARRQIDFTAAAAKVGHGKGLAVVPGLIGESLCIVAARGAFQPMEHHHQRGERIGRRRLGKVDVDEIAIGRAPAFAAIDRRRAHVAA